MKEVILEERAAIERIPLHQVDENLSYVMTSQGFPNGCFVPVQAGNEDWRLLVLERDKAPSLLARSYKSLHEALLLQLRSTAQAPLVYEFGNSSELLSWVRERLKP